MTGQSPNGQPPKQYTIFHIRAEAPKSLFYMKNSRKIHSTEETPIGLFNYIVYWHVITFVLNLNVYLKARRFIAICAKYVMFINFRRRIQLIHRKF